jgi:L-amino acid N-acyltransferase YncA
MATPGTPCDPAHRHRVASAGDLPQIVDIYNATIPSRMVTADLTPVSVDSRRAWFDAHLSATRPIWVIDSPDGIAAWLSASSFYGRPAYQRTVEVSVYVREQCRRTGLAGYLLSQLLARAPALGIDTLLGFIFGHNEPSLRLFARWGFGRWGELPRVAMLDGVERDLVIVGRRVTPP